MENEMHKKHKKGALPLEWDSGKVGKYDEEAPSWVRLTQCEIDKIWSLLANVMEEEVLTRCKVKKEARCKYKGRGKLLSWVCQKGRQEENKAKGHDGKECLAGLFREFINVCRCSVVEGMVPAKEGRRNKHFLQLVNNFHKLAWSGDMANMPRGLSGL